MQNRKQKRSPVVPEDGPVLDRARELRDRLVAAKKEIHELEARDRKKTGVARSRLQLLVRFRLELRPFAALLAILQVERNLTREIERNTKDARLMQDLLFAQEQKRLLFERNPKLKEQMESEYPCLNG